MSYSIVLNTICMQTMPLNTHSFEFETVDSHSKNEWNEEKPWQIKWTNEDKKKLKPLKWILAAKLITKCFLVLQVIDKSMPVFNKQFYSDIVPENIELHSPLSVAIQAESPLGRKLIYTIVKGNELEEFAVDFNTGKIDRNSI